MGTYIISLAIITLGVIFTQVRKIKIKKMDDKSFIMKMDKVKTYFPNASISEMESFIKNTYPNLKKNKINEP